MKQIRKHPFEIKDYITIAMPLGAKILKVDCQNGQNCIWAMVETDNETVDYPFRVLGAGHPVSGIFDKHVATWQNPPFVWHMFQ